MLETINNQIRERALSLERGRIFFADEFADLESPVSVRTMLMKLVKEGSIVRLARGVYCRPKLEGEYGIRMVLPSPETIAETVAAREKVRIIPYGDIAAQELGLSGMVVSDLKYLTDGADRRICLSKGRKIYFNHTDEVKVFGYRNETMRKVAFAVRFLGEDAIDAERRRNIHGHLRTVPEEDFNRDILIPPAWVGKILTDIWNN
jgi:hypothetical protein